MRLLHSGGCHQWDTQRIGVVGAVHLSRVNPDVRLDVKCIGQVLLGILYNIFD